jgi:hypothetical protein
MKRIFGILCMMAFLLSVTVVHAAEDDMGSNGDAGGDLASATLFEISKGNGFLSSTNDRDYYKFPVSNGEEVRIKVSTKNGGFGFVLFDTNQQNVDSVSINPNETPDYLDWTATKDGFFYLSVSMRTGVSATYTIEIISSGSSDENSGGSSSFIDRLGIPGFQIPVIVTGLSLLIGIIRKKKN